ncbi:MAG: hypothetical protein ACRC1K_22205 [Planctomycetia bacterium]
MRGESTRGLTTHDDRRRIEETAGHGWAGVLRMFPFIFLPLVTLVGMLCALIMPYLTGVHDR